MTDRKAIGLPLTNDRKAKGKATNDQANAVELKVEELEERIAPVRF